MANPHIKAIQRSETRENEEFTDTFLCCDERLFKCVVFSGIYTDHRVRNVCIN